MTEHKTFKRHVRERMARTGESYTTARRHLLARAQASPPSHPSRAREVPAGAGVHSATTAMKVLLDEAGHEVGEASLLLAGGGIGIGVFAFRYPEFSSFFLAGRHLWHDDLAFLQGLAGRVGATLEVRETGSRAKARRDLVEMLAHGPVVAFVDLATLGYRGGVEAYYVVVVHDVDESAGTARISDLSEVPLDVPLPALDEARAKHRKFKRRLVRLADVPADPDLQAAGRAGLRACVEAFDDPPMKGSNFRLKGLEVLADRMRGTGKDSWAEVFPPGPRRWGALASFYEYVEHYGSGGGLLRPFFAEALREAGRRLGADPAGAVHAYTALGDAWSRAARSALPPEVPAFAALRARIDATYASYYGDGLAARPQLEALAEERREATRSPFPLDEVAAQEHLDGLADQVAELARREQAALDLLTDLQEAAG